MQSKAKTVAQYIKDLSADRREAITKIRAEILKHLPKGYEEGMSYGMIGYYVPHSLYPDGYHCDPKQPLPFANLASQKNHMALYLACIYGSESLKEWFSEAWLKTGKKLDMGKSCVRFKKLEDVPLKVVGQAIKKVSVKKYVASYEEARAASGSKSNKQAAKVGKKTTPKRAAKTATKKAASKKKVTKRKSTAKKATRR